MKKLIGLFVAILAGVALVSSCTTTSIQDTANMSVDEKLCLLERHCGNYYSKTVNDTLLNIKCSYLTRYEDRARVFNDGPKAAIMEIEIFVIDERGKQHLQMESLLVRQPLTKGWMGVDEEDILYRYYYDNTELYKMDRFDKALIDIAISIRFRD